MNISDLLSKTEAENLVEGYRTIDYSRWDNSGKGNNIHDLLNDTEKGVWDLALEHQDKRDDPGHAEFVTYFALKLIGYYPNAERNVVIPAAILHDIGWSQMTQEELELFYHSNFKLYEPELRDKHQIEGEKLAGKLLKEVNHSEEYRAHILEIISQHDTRDGFFSEEDGLMRDADKLWRYTLPHWLLYLDKRKDTPEWAYNHHIENISKPGFFFSKISKEIARLELEHALTVWKGI